MRPRAICAHCLAHPVRRSRNKYCSTTCRDKAATLPLPLCAAKCGRTVKRRQQRYCSLKCSHLKLRALRRYCAAKCGKRVNKKGAMFCSKSCAWEQRGGREAARKGRIKATEVRRKQYAARLRERLKGVTSIAEVWRLAYERGYCAANASWLRKVQRGDVIMVKERRQNWSAA